MAILLSTVVAIGYLADAASASTDPPATFTITPASGAAVGSEPVTISGPNVGDVVGVIFGRSSVDGEFLSPNEIRVYTPGSEPGNVEVRLDFPVGGDVIVPGGFTYLEASEPGPSEPPLAETGASTTRIGMLAAAVLVASGTSLLV